MQKRRHNNYMQFKLGVYQRIKDNGFVCIRGRFIFVKKEDVCLFKDEAKKHFKNVVPFDIAWYDHIKMNNIIVV